LYRTKNATGKYCNRRRLPISNPVAERAMNQEDT